MTPLLITVDLDEKAPDSIRIYTAKGTRIGHDSVIVSDSRDNAIEMDLFSQPERKITYRLNLDVSDNSEELEEARQELAAVKKQLAQLRESNRKLNEMASPAPPKKEEPEPRKVDKNKYPEVATYKVMQVKDNGELAVMHTYQRLSEALSYLDTVNNSPHFQKEYVLADARHERVEL